MCHAPFTKWVLAAGVYRKGDWIVQSPGLLNAKLAFEGLEPCDGKLSCPVLRGLGAGNSPRLPGPTAEFNGYLLAPICCVCENALLGFLTFRIVPIHKCTLPRVALRLKTYIIP